MQNMQNMGIEIPYAKYAPPPLPMAVTGELSCRLAPDPSPPGRGNRDSRVVRGRARDLGRGQRGTGRSAAAGR